MFKKFGFLVLVLVSVNVFAQNSGDALSVLQAVEKYYSNPSFKASFNYELKGAEGNESTTGDITVKGDKYYVKFGGQEIFNNMQTVATYLKAENEVTIQPYEEDDSDIISPTKIFTLYKSNFSYLLGESVTVGGQTCKVVDLSPNDKSKTYFKIRLTVKPDNSLHSWQIFEKNGSRYLITLTKFEKVASIADGTFTFDKTKYPGVEAIDLQ